MSDTTPQPPTPDEEQGAAKAATPRKKAPARKAAPKAKVSSSPAEAEAEGAAAPEPVVTPDPEPAPASAAPRQPTPSATSTHYERSILDRVRDNAVGPLAVGLFVALAVGLLLSVLVPDDPSALAMIILGALLAAAVGFAVRLVSTERGLRRQVEGFLATVVGVHVMAVTGTVGGEIPLLSDLGASGPGFNEALIVALATPAASTGTLLAGLTAVVIVGWGRARH